MKERIGKLRKNEIGRWEIRDHEFSSGSCLEIKLGGRWINGVIEHNGEDYYFYTQAEGIPIKLYNNMDARIKNY